MKVCVTGAAGFIGSNLVKKCLDMGWNVTGIDDMSNGHEAFIDKRINQFFALDFASDYVMDAIHHQPFDVIFHLAALPRVSYSMLHPTKTNDTNVSKTLELLDEYRQNAHKNKLFVFASSSSVYGGADIRPTPETAPMDPKSPYALQKLIIEQYCRLYSEVYDLDTVCLRFFNVFGQNALGCSPYATALASWLTAIKEGRPMRSDGDGTQSRDLCHVNNVTHACTTIVQKKQFFGGQAFNVACGHATTNNDILRYLMSRYLNATVEHAPVRPGDVMHTQADISKITEQGYAVQVGPMAGIMRTCDWYDANWGAGLHIENMKLKV